MKQIKKLLPIIILIFFSFNIFCSINLTDQEIINIAINEEKDNISLFIKENFNSYKTKAGNKVIFGRNENDNSLTSLSIYFNNNNEVEIIKIWIPIVNQNGIKNELAFTISDKIYYKIFNKKIKLLNWGLRFRKPRQYSILKEKEIDDNKIIFFSVLPDLIVFIITSDLKLNIDSEKLNIYEN